MVLSRRQRRRSSTRQQQQQHLIAGAGTTSIRLRRRSGMASDEDYMAFLDKANKDLGDGQAAAAAAEAQRSGGDKFSFKAVDEGSAVPATIRDVCKKEVYVSDADEPFEEVSLKWTGEGGLPDEVEFAKLIQHWEVASAKIEIMDPTDWDPKGRYSAVVEAIREASRGNDVRVYRVQLEPSLETVRSIIARPRHNGQRPTLVPVYRQMSSDLLTPSAAYLKLAAARASSDYSFLFESAATEQVGRWSFVGAGPRKVLTTGGGDFGPETDPLPGLEAELARHVVADVPGLKLPPLTGGAIGYVGYDCVRYFEPRTARYAVRDVLAIPESLFMLFDTIVAFDRYYGVIKVIGYVAVPPPGAKDEDLVSAYRKACAVVDGLVDVLDAPGLDVAPQQPTVTLGRTAQSNIGRDGYEAHVRRLKGHIERGDIFQAVPSQRLSRPTDLHAFNIYRHLRTVNPSPYLFYLDCRDFCIVGASPELLVKSEEEEEEQEGEEEEEEDKNNKAEEEDQGEVTRKKKRIITHPIAGTVPRGSSAAEDARLAAELRASLKDRAEHVMLVDLARNDINRVCEPRSVRVDRLMVVEKFSHVQHLVSQVSGVLRRGKSRFDAFRSVFPAGTVSGAPKVRAMELIAELEGEKRGVYAGAVGYFGYQVEDGGGNVVDGAMDTCIALRTMVVKDGVAYLQAGGGIVFDSDEGDEYQETINKLGANMQCIASAEEYYHRLQKQRQDG
ncbi:hypothetical protein CP532_2838 [Ophiocordyceps camponoti-leonardi (nom. inval.)]|nr:hypothetical protein CP532_2838 [Ophiocordyceps camponoti-leonardi (nom. inval.)]